MDSQALNELAIDKTYEKFLKQDARAVRQAGAGATDAGLAITRSCLGPFVEHLKQALVVSTDNTRQENKFIAVVKNLDVEVLALSVIQAVLHCVAKQDTLRDTVETIGIDVSNECWAAKLTQDNPKLAANIAKYVTRRYSKVQQRKRSAVSIAEREGYTQRLWSRPATLVAGNWCLNALRIALPDVFEVELDLAGRAAAISLSEKAWDWADAAVAEVLRRNPVYLPMIEPPRPWTGFYRGGPIDERQNPPLVRTRHRATEAAVKSAIRSGQMQPALDGLNALQATAFTVNKPVMDVIQQCWDQKRAVKGLPPRENVPVPFAPLNMDEAQKRLWKKREHDVKTRNVGFIGDRLMFKEDMGTAALMAEHERFYTPMNLDWRGRVYALPFFNFQREDRVRAMFLFADGEPIGEEGLWWLKVHVANCGDFGKISKRPLEERVQWVNENLTMIEHVATNAMWKKAFDWWTQADKPFLFLAACIELTNAITVGPSYVTCLPVSFDGSCSGLQHLCAMTRAPEGHLVNLTNNEVPADVYQTVADATVLRLQIDAANGDEKAKVWLAYGVDRKVVKRNVMTYAYSSKKFGMAQQQEVDLMVPLRFEVMEGKRAEHPFGDNESTQMAAARYLAAHVYSAIENVVTLPALAMAFLQKSARSLAHEGKPLTWTTPVGLPWINRYHEPKLLQVRLWLHDRGAKVEHRIALAVDDKPEIDKDRASNGVAPNFVHALDAAHLLLVARGSACLDITQLATVHDSFGCLASQATRFNRLIREQFVEMYTTHDVLQEVLEQAKHDLTPANWQRLPDVPLRGALNLNEVMEATYAFA